MASVLIVDDLQDNIDVLRFDLEDEGFEVYTAADGEEGLRVAAEKLPDCIMMDYHMPVLDGISAVRRLKADERLRHIPVIMLSADDAEATVVAGLEAGAMDYIAKPFSFPVALARVRSAVRIKQAQAAEQQLRVAAEEASKARTAFLANMSHEIRTPLNGILGMAQLLSGTTLTGLQYDYVTTVTNSGQMLQHLINDLLDFAKIESGNIQLERLEVDLRQLVEDCLALFTGRAIEAGINLYGLVDASVPQTVITDPTRVQQILANLVSNAIKFTEQGHVLIRMSGEVADDGHHRILLTVEDTGCGMTPEQAEQVFQPFVQADASIPRKHGGTGLGLAICKDLAEAMGGGVSVCSEPGLGTTFSTHWQVELHRATFAFRKRKHERVLIIDSDALAGECLQLKLDYLGYEARISCDVQTADAALRQGRWQAVAIALDDPDFAPLITRLAQDPAGPALVLTGSPLLRNHLADIGEQALEHFISQPYRLVQLAAALDLDLHKERLEADSIDQLAGRRVLVAEDNIVNQRIVTNLLEKLGCIVTMADNGAVAVASAKTGSYDWVLMDCYMPEMNGLDATRAIRCWEHEEIKDRPRPPLPIIALTASVDPEPCFEAGMDDFLRKPLKRKDLSNMLLKHISDPTTVRLRAVQD